MSERAEAALECHHCPGVHMEPWSVTLAVYVCPCCSSRFGAYSGDELHCGSHNDYATYLCKASR